MLEHLNASEGLSAGLKALPDQVSRFASTQAAWRFYANASVTLAKLQEPLTAAAHAGVGRRCDHYARCLHDWSRLSYQHRNQPDTYAITHGTDIGYDLPTSLLVSDRDGQPLAPVAQRLVSADGSDATYGGATPDPPAKDHRDALSEAIAHVEGQGCARPLVHSIDREGDSAGHLRRWDAAGRLWLVRVKDNPRLDYDGRPMACKAVAPGLTLTQPRSVTYHGQPCWPWVAEAAVTLSRAAKPSQQQGKQPAVPGVPVAARRVVSRVLSDAGEVLAEWLLVTNVDGVDASTLALWYYWRWQIESFFKLLKSAGHPLAAWQQESALAIAKRLLVASMACVTVWAIAADERPEAAGLRRFLIQLSGRQRRHKTEFTHPARLAGLWVFLSMIEVMEAYSQEELDGLTATARQFLGKVV